MKKTVFIIATFFGIAAASAQSYTSEFQFGVRGGANFSKITSNDNFESPDSRTDFYAGLVAELPLQERFSLQGEVFYSGQGFKSSRKYALNETTDFKYKADYIQVPLLAKFYIVEGLSAAAGPQFGFKVNEKLDYTTTGGKVEMDNLKTFDFQGTAGVEYKFDNGLFLQGRYSHGFSDLIKDTNLHTSVFSAGLGYMF